MLTSSYCTIRNSQESHLGYDICLHPRISPGIHIGIEILWFIQVGKGMLTTASYEARKFGVRSGMPGFIAQKLCPEMVFVPINMARYSEMSKRVMRIFRQYDPEMLAASVDEGYLKYVALIKLSLMDLCSCDINLTVLQDIARLMAWTLKNVCAECDSR